jgi:peptide/nickel transport system substrate-binding protein
MVVIPDTSNVVAQFISGSLDYIGWGNDVINSSEKQQIRDSLSADAFTEYSYTTNPCGIFLKQCYEPFQDINVRIAIQKAIDMDLVTTQYYGLDSDALQLFGIFSQSTDWSSVSTWDDELLDTYSYDPEAAKQLLADAGYPDGFEFTIVLFSQQDVDLYTLAAEMLKEVGIIMNIETVSTPPEMQAVGLDSTDVRCIAGTCCLYALSGGIDNYASFGNNNNGAINDPTLDEMALAIQNATTMEEQVAAAQAEDLYVGQQHYTIQLGPCEIVSSFVSSRVHGLNGERIFKNWNDTTVLTHLWVTD